MFIATTTPEARPSSVGAAWSGMEILAPTARADANTCRCLRSLADRVARVAINMSLLWSLAGRATCVAINMPLLWSLTGRAAGAAIDMPLLTELRSIPL